MTGPGEDVSCEANHTGRLIVKIAGNTYGCNACGTTFCREPAELLAAEPSAGVPAIDLRQSAALRDLQAVGK